MAPHRASIIGVQRDSEIAVTAAPLAYVIDDEPDVREAIAMLLRSVSIEVEAYGSALGFLERFEGVSERGMILLLDVRMGDMGHSRQAKSGQRYFSAENSFFY